MKITAIQAKAAKMASKDYSRPVLNAILVTTDGERSTVVATDSYKLISISTPSTEAASVGVYELAGVDQAAKIGKITKSPDVELPAANADLKFPNWENIKPDLTNACRVKLNRKYLIELLQTIEETEIELAVLPEVSNPVVVTASGEPAHEYYGLIMPLRG